MSPAAGRSWARFCELRSDLAVRDYLGLSVEEWDDQPVEFVAWARQFHQIIVDRQNQPADDATRADLRKMLGEAGG